ncbi:hypothetical protein E3P99_02573 [Wallemia hederae]|uniref:DNA polymerase kappa n=1 Tax=Wallemia hederae TaxID=1540922 RepID=A0A4T0FIZ6_9BASI|nr:hypothetical protein E3P99_02573 [Wallemia hederae]
MPSSDDNASLLRRLAGPSAGKAGLDTQNQERINKIIHDASKGGRFFNNEVKRDQHTSAKIDSMKAVLRRRMQGANHASITHTVTAQLRKMETERDLSQYIMHCDMDMFYAAVEVLDDSSLEGKAFGVGKGILTTASYEARKFGIRSAMPCFIAHKLCDHFVEVPMRMERYVEKSRQVMEIFSRYDENMAGASLDEAYLNVTSYMNDHALTPQQVSQELRKAVQEETGLTVSTGIAPNKTLAKICSDKVGILSEQMCLLTTYQNKPNGEYTMEFSKEAVLAFMKDLPVRKVPGVGRINERLVQSLGIETCGDITSHLVEIHLLRKELQSDGLLRANLGIFSNVVAPSKREDRKSVGTEKTFQPLSDTPALMDKLHHLCDELEGDLKRTQFKGRTVTLKYKKDTFENSTRAMSVDKYINKSEEIWPVAKELLERELPLTLRLLGVRLTNLMYIGGGGNEITKFFTKPQEQGDADTSSVHEQHQDFDDRSDSDIEIIEKPTAAKKEEGAVGLSVEHKPDKGKGVAKEVSVEADPEQSKSNDVAEDASALAKPFFDDLDDEQAPVELSDEADSSDGDVEIVQPQPMAKRKEIETKEPEQEDSSVRYDATADGGSANVLECPVCMKSLRVSNDSFNQHLDECLTQQEIDFIANNPTPPSKPSHKKHKPDPFSGFKAK